MFMYVHMYTYEGVHACVCVGRTNSRCEMIMNVVTYVADVHVLFVL